jgi:hypothetical protein
MGGILLKRGEKIIFLVITFLLFFVFSMFIVLSDDVITEVNISNAAPILSEIIPNQTWQENTDNLNAFDLDDYFIDPNLDTLTYTVSNTTNITIVIDSDNSVSFYPDTGFIGTRNVTFFASDGFLTIQSNQVYLNVGTDNEPPQWISSSRTGGSTIYQNDYINFSAIWSDNVELRSYIFSINQGSGWTNYTETNFSGKQNTSKYRVIISASAGIEVYWKFYAFDTSGNINQTSIKSFNISSRPSPPPSGGEEVTGGAFGGLLEGIRQAIFGDAAAVSRNFTVSPSSLKVSLKQGKSTTTFLRITNIGNRDLNFTVLLKGLEDFVIISDNEFSLSSGQSKDLIIDFKAARDSEPGEYNGAIILNSTETREVPVVLIINLFELVFDIDINISEKYKIVKPGNPVKANITISNIKDIEQTKAELYIAVKDFWGNIYDSSEQEVEFSSVIYLEKELLIPESANEGIYLYYGRITNNESIAISAETFEVGVRALFLSFLKSGFLFLLILLLCIILAIFMVRLKRKKEREKLLKLYLMVNEMKNLISEDKFDEALNIYIRIKTMYGEKVPEEIRKDKEKLKQAIKKLSKRLKEQKIIEKQQKKNNKEEASVKKPQSNKEKNIEHKQENKEDNKEEETFKKNNEEQDKPKEKNKEQNNNEKIKDIKKSPKEAEENPSGKQNL